jgi:cytochrome c553
MLANRLHRSVVLACLVGLTGLPVCASELIDLRGIAAIQGDATAGKTKAAVCMACHGPAGLSPIPTFPNLAGQHAEYLYWQLVEFKHEARPESPMTAQVANLDETAMRDLAVYFSSLPGATPPPAPSSTERGGHLYREGDPTAGVPPCQGCHGRDAEGHPLAGSDAHWRAYPVLRGQHAGYLAQRLKDFRDGKHTLSSNDHVMMPIARALDDASIEAVTAWLESPSP